MTNDLISRKWLMECIDEGWIKFDAEKDTNTYIHLIRDIAPSAQQWIPIEDRQPEFGKDVLISHRGFVSIDWLTQSEGDAYFFASRVAIADIDAWMSLPAPWEGEDE